MVNVVVAACTVSVAVVDVVAAVVNYDVVIAAAATIAVAGVFNISVVNLVFYNAVVVNVAVAASNCQRCCRCCCFHCLCSC